MVARTDEIGSADVRCRGLKDMSTHTRHSINAYYLLIVENHDAKLDAEFHVKLPDQSSLVADALDDESFSVLLDSFPKNSE